MHRTIKKAFAFIVTLCLLLSVIPMGAQAALVQGEDYIIQQLSLGEDLVLHLRASLPESAASLAKDATGTITYAGKTSTYTLDDLTPDENGMYDMPVEMAVPQMTDDIHALVTAKVLGVNQEVINEHYSIRNYLTSIIDGDYSQTTKDLCLELLNMGSWAQLYFNYNISDLANSGGYDIQPSNPVPDEIPTTNVEGKVEGILFYGASVRFLSKTAVRFYFKADSGVEGYTFTIGDQKVDPVAKDGLYYIETPGINPQNMSDEITVSVTDGNDTLSFGYAPIWYFIRAYHNNDNEYHIGLMEAAYSYFKTAESYKTQICMDLDISTLSGSFESIGLGFYPLNFEGDINDYTDRIEVPTGETYTLKLDQGKYLVDGEFLGIGVTVLGGPAWDTTFGDGANDRHTIQISGLRLEGPEERPIDLNFATIASGTVDTGYTNANASATVSLTDGVITFANGIFTDGYKITFNEVDSYIELDMQLSTLSGNYETIGIGFYGYDFEGDINDYVDRIEVPTGDTYTVKLDLSKYLVDGEFPGIGFAVLGGPTWDAKLEDGTPDRHSITVSAIRLNGELDQTIDLSKASMKAGTDGTGYTNANAGGSAVVTDGVVTISNGFFTDGYKLLFVDETIPDVTEPETTEPETTEPETTEPEPTDPPLEEFDNTLSLDMQIDTLSGNWANDIEMRFYTYDFEGNPHEVYTDSIILKAGEKKTVKLNADKYLVDGQLTGIGIGIFGGPEWNTQISDGVYDRHTVTISNVMLEGEQTVAFDLSKSTIASGTTDTGYTAGNGSGTAVFGESIVISNGFCYDVHKISLDEDTNTYITMDMQIDTLSGNWANDIEMRFYTYDFEGNPHEVYTDSIILKAGEKKTVKLNADKYLVDGQLTGIGIGIFGGPEWNTQISDGVYDRHTVTISNVMLEGEQTVAFDLSKSTIASGTANTGYTAGNGSGTAVFGESIVISNGFCYDVHKISLAEDTNTYLALDLLLTTLGNSTDPVEIGFFPNNFTGSINDCTDKIVVTAGAATTVKLDLDNYLVNGDLTGIGFAIFGGPEWNTQLADGTYDRHTLTVSGVRLEGAQSAVYDLNQSVWTGGANSGYTDANSAGIGSIVNGSVVITGGFRYDAHKITLVKAPDTYLCLDMQFTTLGGSTAPVDIGFYPSNFEGDINNHTDKIAVTAGQQTTVKLDLAKYLVDGELTGIGFAIFGGPAWDAKLPDGYTPDRHTITISAVYLEGKQDTAFDLSQSAWAGGNNGTGFTNANGSGAATIGQSIVITNGFQYDAHKITLVEDTSTYIEMDLLLTTLGNSTDPVEIRFCNYNQEDSVHSTYTNNLQVVAGTKTSIKLKVDDYLVDGQLPGFGIAIFGGPEWNTQLEDGTYDRHSVVISNLRLTGVNARDIDLSTATVAVGIPGSNAGGQIAIVDGEIVITGGFRYDGHKITF